MIEVVIADHQDVFRTEIEETLKVEDGLRMVGEAPCPEQLLNTLESISPHVLLLSKKFLPVIADMNPKLERNNTALLLLAEDNDRVAYLRQLHARGFVNRSINGSVLVDAMRRVARGELFVQNRSSDKREERVLHVCYDLPTLLSRECLLISMGYQVRTVLGNDGLLATMDTDAFDFALIGEDESMVQQQSAVRLLQERHPAAPVIALGHESDKIEGTVF